MWTFIDSEIKWKTDDTIKDEFYIQYSNKERNIHAEFKIKWYFLNIPVPRLEIFDDAWFALYQYGQDFLKMLSDNNDKSITKDEMKVKLLEIGFIDKTYEN